MEDNEKIIHHKPKKNLKKPFNVNWYVGLGSVLVIIILFNIIQVSSFGGMFDQKLTQAKKDAQPAQIELTIITNDACQDCFDIFPMLDNLRQNNIEIIKEKNIEFDSEKGKDLIKKYRIDKIPTMIIFGEIDKLTFRELEKREDALVFSQIKPIYTEAKTGKVKGRVSAEVIVDSSCSQCSNMDIILNLLKTDGVKFVSENMVEYDSQKGKNLIEKYSISVLPALVLSKNLNVYNSEPVQGWASVGSIEKDGSYVTRMALPPFMNLTAKKIEGLVSAIYLEDKSCQECYDVKKLHQPILESMGIALDQEKGVDLSSAEGKKLMAKYKIEKVPTLILQGDMKRYMVLVEAWKNVGTVEPDGAYVFRSVEVAKQPYKDLTQGKIVGAESFT